MRAIPLRPSSPISSLSHQFSQSSLIFPFINISFALKHPIFPAFEHHFFPYTLSKLIRASLYQTLCKNCHWTQYQHYPVFKHHLFIHSVEIIAIVNIIVTFWSHFPRIGVPLFYTPYQIAQHLVSRFSRTLLLRHSPFPIRCFFYFYFYCTTYCRYQVPDVTVPQLILAMQR